MERTRPLLFGLALALGAFFISRAPAAPVEQPLTYRAYIAKVLRTQAEQDPHQPSGAAVFLGDSLTQGLAVLAVDPVAVNYGIGHQDTAGLLAALPDYSAVTRARVVVLTIGTNDLARNLPKLPEHLRAIRDAIPVPLVWNAVPPSDRFDPTDANAIIRDLCTQRPDCTFVETDFAPEDFSDGTHLSRSGYAKWIANLRQTVGARVL